MNQIDNSECYNCGCELDEVMNSKEHLIPESLGSPKWSYGLLCQDCNNKHGETYDAELFRQIGFIGDVLGVNRRSKDKLLKGATSSGRPYEVFSGMKPVIGIKIQTKHHVQKLTGESHEDVIRQAKRYIKKNRKLFKDVESVCKDLEKAQFNYEYPDEDNQIWITNNLSEKPNEVILRMCPNMVKGVMKVAINMYLNQGGSIQDISETIDFFRTSNDEFKANPQMVRMIHENRVFRKLGTDEVGHVCHIRGNSEEKYLVAYIEFFSIFRFIVFLNLTYQGPDISYKWGYDVLKKEYFTPDVEILVTKNDMLDMQFNADNPLGMEKLHTRIVEINDKRVEMLKNGLKE